MINGPGGTAAVINSHPGITSVQVAKYDRVINYRNRARWLCRRELHRRSCDPGLRRTVHVFLHVARLLFNDLSFSQLCGQVLTHTFP
jgi:hypothetical protein